MRGAIALAFSSLLLAPLIAHADDAQLYSGQVQLSMGATYDRVDPTDPPGPLLHTASLSPELLGTYYLSPLILEPMGPLALLNFYQHPGNLHAGFTQETDVNRVVDAWHTSRRAIAVTAGGEGYPWHESGLWIDMTSDYAGLSSDAHSALGLSYTAGFIHYFRPNLRGELGYVGSVRQTTRVLGDVSASIEDLDVARNGGRAAAEAVLLDDRLGIRMDVSLGQLTQDRSDTGAQGKSLPGDYTHGLDFGAQGTATGFLGRQFSAALAGGIRGSSTSTKADLGGGASSTSTTLTEFLAPNLRYFFLENLYAQLDYEIDFSNISGSQSPSSSEVDQSANLAAAYRF